MIEEKLEILLITYNRAKDLENTFKQLLGSSFANCKFTVLDNCSTDTTPEICSKYQKLFPKMKILRHKKNIGGGPNYLRALELSDSIYTWVLCDDDEYDFSDCSDVIDAIESEKFDIIIVTSHFQYGWERGLETTSTELMKRGSRYYHTLSFMPAIIFKTDLFDSYCIHKGYFNVHNLYPHFEFINKSVEENFTIYVSKNEIVKVGTNNQSAFSPLYLRLVWMNSCMSIKDHKIRKQTIYFSESYYSIIKNFFIVILIEKWNNKKVFDIIIQLKNAFIINFGLSTDLIILLFIFIFAIIPSFFYRMSVRVYISINKEKNEEILEKLIKDKNKSVFNY
jgi:glycosyltransferase involved in cell wall biosynthesis